LIFSFLQKLLEATTKVSEPVNYPDADNLSTEFLIEHIDSVFVAFERSPWRNYTSFIDFCEHLLPYNIFNEKRENWFFPIASETERFLRWSFNKVATKTNY
jgi:hypothetical protein